MKSRGVPKITKIPYAQGNSKDRWLRVHKEYLRFRKTDEFVRWRHKQFLKQGGTCYYCHLPVFGGTRLNVDHVLAKSRGGSNRTSNLVLACANYNKEKNTRILKPEELSKLHKRNKSKKGTYLKTKELYPTEYDIAQQIKNIL